MANNETLGASFSIDVTNLKAGLAQANRAIRESESEFKAAAAGMDDWSKSQEGLTAKIKSLNNITEIQSAKVDALQGEYDRLIADGLDPTSKAAVELRTKINNETAALNKNKAELERQKQALEDLENASDDAGDAVDDLGDAAKDSGDGFTIANGAVAGFIANGLTALISKCGSAISSLAGLSQETQEYRNEIAKLETAFQMAGLSADNAEATFSALYSVMGDEGAAVEAAQQLSKISKNETELAANTRILTGVMAKYGTSIPLEGLAEGMAATSAMGEVQGVLADALEWQKINLEEYNAKLAELTTAEERAAYIQETLTGLYGESADAYMENNASVIAARKATLEYQDSMAELGAEMEPVTTAVTEMKNEFVKGLTPALKKDVIPQVKSFVNELKESGTISKFSDSISNIAKKVLPPLSKAIKFAAENIETLATVTFVAVTAFKAITAAMKVHAAISAATAAVKGLTTGVTLATKAQVIWNAAMSANPIGAVITAVALLTAGIAMLVSSQKNAAKSTELLSESQRKAVDAAEEAADAYRDEMDAANELAGAQIANVNYVKNNLLPQLQNVIDKNGEVKKGDEARAEFILGELNNALGTEYSSLKDIVDANGQIKDSIYDVIEAKKAQILLEAHEETYRLAIENVAEAEKARAIQAQELFKQEEVVEQKRQELAELRESYSSTWSRQRRMAHRQAIANAQAELRNEEEILEEKQDAYLQSENSIYQYHNQINAYETASTLVLQGEVDKAIAILDNLGSGYQTAASVAGLAADEQKAILGQQVIDTEINAQLMKEAYENGVEGVSEEMVKTAQEQAESAKEEFYKVGGDITKGIAEGAEGEEKTKWTLSSAMSGLIDSALAAAKKAAGIKSPSTLFKRIIGKNIGLGVAAGIDESTPAIVKSAKTQVREIKNAFDAQAVSATISASTPAPVSGSEESDEGSSKRVVVYQTNNYSQKHSRLELYKTKQATAAAVRLAMNGA